MIPNYLELVLFKAYAEIKSEASRYYFSFFWWVIEPTLFMFTFYIVFEMVLKSGGDNFVLFLFVGLVNWKWFSCTVNYGATSITSNNVIIQQVFLNNLVFPFTVMLTNTFRYLITFVILIIFIFAVGVKPNLTWFSIIYIFIIQFFFINACAMIVALITPFFTDFSLVIENVMLLLFFLSGVVFDMANVPAHLAKYLYLNPMAVLIRENRTVLIYGHWPDWNGLHLIAVLTVAITVLIYSYQRRYDRVYPKLYM